ncbi:MAG: hypothetical protein JNL36_00120 [Candidatus Kapabacteria bacterium]|nr:hypothetical protein [Candidatus Kapabacteria bacterium]
MKTTLKLFGLLSICFAMLLGCEESNILQPQKSLYPEVKDCKWPDYLDSFSQNRSWYYYSIQSSNQGNFLLYTLDYTNRYYLLNVSTGQSSFIDFNKMLPNHLNFEALGSAVSCPYDENKIMLNILLSTDTIGNGKGYVEGQYLYEFNQSNNDLKDVSPDFFGKYGMNPRSGVANLLRWLNTSSIGNDFVVLSNYGMYHIQNQTLTPTINDPKFNISISSDGKNIFRVVHGDFVRIDDQDPFSDGYKKYFFYLNNVLLEFDSLFITSLDGGELYFTQNGKYLVGAFIRGQFIPNPLDIHGNIDSSKIIPKEKLNTKEFFVIDVEKTLSSGKLVLVYNFSFVKKYCLFRVNSVKPLTNNTVTVSMSYDRYDIADIYEMSFDGRILRKLRK